MITVTQRDDSHWEVTVQSDVTTHHQVRATMAEVERFGGGASAEDLLRESFHFLLEREPNTSILRSFDLPVISRYFPEYEAEIRERLGAR